MEAYRAQELRIEELNDTIAQGKGKATEAWLEQLKKEREDVGKALKQEPWLQEANCLEISVHLQAFAMTPGAFRSRDHRFFRPGHYVKEAYAPEAVCQQPNYKSVDVLLAYWGMLTTSNCLLHRAKVPIA